MADSEAKPPAKAEDTQASGGGQRRTGGGYQRAFKAPTPGYEKSTFDWNNSKTKAVRFQENFDDLATYVGANYDTGAAEAAAAIRSREPPLSTSPHALRKPLRHGRSTSGETITRSSRNRREHGRM